MEAAIKQVGCTTVNCGVAGISFTVATTAVLGPSQPAADVQDT